MAIEKVATTTELLGCFRKESAWNIITDYTRYPQFIDNIQKVEVTERSGDEGVSRWFLTLDNAPLTWLERDYFDRSRFEVMFKSIEGDFDNINGRWKIKERADSGISILFELEYNLGIPVIEEVLGPILFGKMKANVDRMMAAIHKELSRKACDERRFPRHAIRRSIDCTLDGTACTLFVIDLSARGMMTRRLHAVTDKTRLTIGGHTLDIVAVHGDDTHNRTRFIFRKPLAESELMALLNEISTDEIAPHAPIVEPRDAIVICSDRKTAIRLHALSQEGMKFSYHGDETPNLDLFTIGSLPIILKEIVHDAKSNLVSVRFKSLLDDGQYRTVREHFGMA
jgi:ribosome-associated toxin RatA of RatAB toxin-antitoxin module